MGRRSRKAVVAGLLVLAGVAGIAAVGWACVPISTVSVTPAQAKPGDEVIVSGIRFLAPSPVSLHFHSPTSPVVVTMEMPRSANSLFKTTITVPPSTPPGPLVVVATQDAFPEGAAAGWGVPTRAVITVLDSAGNAPPTTISTVAGRPADLVEDTVEPVTVLLVGLGVAAAALSVVGLAARRAGRAHAIAAEGRP